MVKQDVPLQPMECHGGAGFHAAARGGDHGGAGGPAPTEAAACGRPLPEQIPGQTCSPWRGDHTGAGDPAGAAARRGARLEQFSPEGWTPWYGPISGAVLEERKQRSCSSSMWTVLVFSGMPVPDSLMDIDLDSILKLVLVLLVSKHEDQWELKDSSLQSGYERGQSCCF
ncbi:uncharacterized protein [Anas platyrhynchos]|uniref:uncharacterized protein isoform X2 n=1 Tax=Anas platyrhynchos TaxID=8839 RepID=UPI003AF315B3